MIRVIATISLKEGKRKSYLEELYKIMPMVHIEHGCIEYGPHIDFDSGFDFDYLPAYTPPSQTIAVIVILPAML